MWTYSSQKYSSTGVQQLTKDYLARLREILSDVEMQTYFRTKEKSLPKPLLERITQDAVLQSILSEIREWR